MLPDELRHSASSFVYFSHTAGAEGGDERSRRVPASGNATAFTHQLPPLPQRGRGAGVRAALTYPPAPFLSHAVGEEGGDAT